MTVAAAEPAIKALIEPDGVPTTDANAVRAAEVIIEKRSLSSEQANLEALATAWRGLETAAFERPLIQGLKENMSPLMQPDPIARFQDSLARARAASTYEASPERPSSEDPTSMMLATADEHGMPSVRVVLLKGLDERGFVFYTNRQSRKGRELSVNPKAALCFLFSALAEQVRIEGHVEHASEHESDVYFASRPRESQLGAWASHQSQAIGSRDELEHALRAVEARFDGQDVPRPPHWGGYRVVPSRIEFWKEGKFRIHDREVYEREPNGAWLVKRLSP